MKMADPGGHITATREELRLANEKAQRRATLRAEFLKEISNPHRHASGEGGTVFDTGIQRFMSMKVSGIDHFKPTPVSSLWGLALVVIPIISYTAWMKTDRDKRELKFRTGQVAYKDRNFKFI